LRIFVLIDIAAGLSYRGIKHIHADVAFDMIGRIVFDRLFPLAHLKVP
jgi:hypothetical protein